MLTGAMQQEHGPLLWQRIQNAGSISKALKILQKASVDEVEEARDIGTLGLVTPAVRAAAAKGKHGEPELLSPKPLHVHDWVPDGICPQCDDRCVVCRLCLETHCLICQPIDGHRGP